MCLSGALAGLGGASHEGDFAYQIDPTGLQSSFYGYTGIVVAALARYNPLAVVPVAVPARRPAERRLHAAGSRLPLRPRRRDAGDDPVLRPRRRVLVRYRIRFGRRRRRPGRAGGGVVIARP